MRLASTGSDMFTLSGRTVDQLIRAGSGDAVLLYLYVLRTGGTATIADASRMLGKTQREIALSMALLEKLELLQNNEKYAASAQETAESSVTATRLQKEEMPDYSADDIKRELKNGSVFYSLVQEVQKSLGRILSSDDLIKLFGIYDNVGLPPEVILHLVTYCVDENSRRYGPGRIPTMRYIEKAAFTWEREGILSLDEAERYIKSLEAKRSLTGDIKKILQIKDRELTPGERRYVDGWLSLGIEAELIELAYDKTFVKTGRLAWPYMDSILNSWHQKGLHTVAEIEAKDGRGAGGSRDKKPVKETKSSAPSLTDIEHMKKFLEKLREE